MEKTTLGLLISMHFICFFLSCAVKKKRFQGLSILVFVMVSVLLRLIIPTHQNPDYVNYLERDFFLKGDLTDLFEPLSKIIYSISRFLENDHVGALENLYQINFIFSLIFFCFLALSRKVHLIAKIIFFSFIYYFSTYVVIRNAPLIYLLAYYLISRKPLNLGRVFLLFSTHISSIIIPAIKIMSRTRLYIVILFSAITIIILPYLVEYILQKAELFGSFSLYVSYFSISNNISANHLILLGFNSLILLIIGFFSKFRNISKTTWVAYITYILGFVVNPVIGSRLSIYLLIFLLFTTDSLFQRLKGQKNLTLFKFLFLPLSLAYTIFIFFDVHTYA